MKKKVVARCCPSLLYQSEASGNFRDASDVSSPRVNRKNEILQRFCSFYFIFCLWASKVRRCMAVESVVLASIRDDATRKRLNRLPKRQTPGVGSDLSPDTRDSFLPTAVGDTILTHPGLIFKARLLRIEHDPHTKPSRFSECGRRDLSNDTLLGTDTLFSSLWSNRAFWKIGRGGVLPCVTYSGVWHWYYFSA